MKHIIKTTYHLDDITKILDSANCGDEIIITSGTYYSYPWDLKSDLTITLEDDANIYFSSNEEDYEKKTFIRFEGVECFSYHPLIYSLNQNNITIQGNGHLFGNGYVWWKSKKLQAKACDRLCKSEYNKIDINDRVINLKESYLRPDFIEIINGNNIILKDFTIQDSPMWMIHPVYCKNVLVENVKVISDGPNTDGCDPDSCEDVLIKNCIFETGDDCIAIDSGLNEDGWRVNKPCKNIKVIDCTFNKGHAAIAIGSMVSGGIEDVYISNNVINSCERGIRVKSIKGRGGYVKNINVENLKMSVEKEGIEITMNYPSSTSIPCSDTPSNFKDFHFKNIKINKAKTGVSIIGLESSNVEYVEFENLKINNVETIKNIEHCKKVIGI